MELLDRDQLDMPRTGVQVALLHLSLAAWTRSTTKSTLHAWSTPSRQAGRTIFSCLQKKGGAESSLLTCIHQGRWSTAAVDESAIDTQAACIELSLLAWTSKFHDHRSFP